jgi:hypothetical protein
MKRRRRGERRALRRRRRAVVEANFGLAWASCGQQKTSSPHGLTAKWVFNAGTPIAEGALASRASWGRGFRSVATGPATTVRRGEWPMARASPARIAQRQSTSVAISECERCSGPRVGHEAPRQR